MSQRLSDRLKSHLSRRAWSYALIVPLCGAGLLAKGLGLRASVTNLITAENQPSKYEIHVTSADPRDGAFEVPLDATINVELKLPNGGIDVATIDEKSVMLIRTRDQMQVDAAVKLVGSRMIALRPAKPLATATNYTLIVTSGIKHRSGASVVPWTSSFTTVNVIDPTIRFDKLLQPAASGVGFTCVRVGPDGKLWASSDDGRIFRFPIETGGNLGTPDIVTS